MTIMILITVSTIVIGKQLNERIHTQQVYANINNSTTQIHI